MRNKFKIEVKLCIILVALVINSCKKEENIPILTTSGITNILGTSAVAGGSITNEGSGTVISRGVCWSIVTNPTISDNKTSDGTGAGTFISNITDLNGGTVYYVRAYATNNIGTGYGLVMSFNTLGQVPIPTIATATNIDTSSATMNCIVNPKYLSTVVIFEYGITESYGSTDTATQSPLTGNENINVSFILTGLTPGTTYHYRVKAINTLGDPYSEDITFTTLGQIPTVVTQNATIISQTSATLNGTINSNYLSSIVTFEYGTSITYGNIMKAAQSPVTENNLIGVSANISDLTPNTTYHYRLIAVNSIGTTYGTDIQFTTLAPIIVTDADGNIYNFITIGNQVWMSENLKTTKYRNGDDILTLTFQDIAGYCWYNDDPTTYKNVYGALYNYFAVVDSRNLCPLGWHVPTDAEWTVLSENLGGWKVAGGMLKEAGLVHWNSPNKGASNQTGFTALPGGKRGWDGFGQIGYNGFWWSSSGPSRYLSYASDYALGDSNVPEEGRSVRCVKDFP